MGSKRFNFGGQVYIVSWRWGNEMGALKAEAQRNYDFGGLLVKHDPSTAERFFYQFSADPIGRKIGMLFVARYERDPNHDASARDIRSSLGEAPAKPLGRPRKYASST